MTDKRHTAGLLRSKGFCWIVTRPKWPGLWSQAGRVIELSPHGVWWADVPQDQWATDPSDRASVLAEFDGEYGDRRQELMFIGKAMNEVEMRVALDAALLTDAEMTGGPAVWDAITDPFPAWPTPGETDTPHTHSETTCPPPTFRVHADRGTGSDRHHRHSHRPVPARRPSSVKSAVTACSRGTCCG